MVRAPASRGAGGRGARGRRGQPAAIGPRAVYAVGRSHCGDKKRGEVEEE